MERAAALGPFMVVMWAKARVLALAPWLRARWSQSATGSLVECLQWLVGIRALLRAAKCTFAGVVMRKAQPKRSAGRIQRDRSAICDAHPVSAAQIVPNVGILLRKLCVCPATQKKSRRAAQCSFALDFPGLPGQAPAPIGHYTDWDVQSWHIHRYALNGLVSSFSTALSDLIPQLKQLIDNY